MRYPVDMRWLGTWACSWVLLAAGCSDDGPLFGDDDDTGATTGSSTPPPSFDYSTCSSPALHAPSCSGSACGRTPEAEGYLAIILDEVAMAGYAGNFTPTRAEHFPLVDELDIDYQLHVGWFRAATTVHLDVPGTEELLRDEMAAHVASWQIPAGVASPDAIAAAVEGCHALLDYDPCEDNQPDFLVYDRYDWAEPACVYKSSYVVVDAHDASTLECAVEEPQPCG